MEAGLAGAPKLRLTLRMDLGLNQLLPSAGVRLDGRLRGASTAWGRAGLPRRRVGVQPGAASSGVRPAHGRATSSSTNTLVVRPLIALLTPHGDGTVVHPVPGSHRQSPPRMTTLCVVDLMTPIIFEELVEATQT